MIQYNAKIKSPKFLTCNHRAGPDNMLYKTS